MNAHLETHEYRPELLSRRGEFVAWSLALLLAAAALILSLTRNNIPGPLAFLAAFVFAAAAAISLGNWMDRRTVLRLDDSGMVFDNGLRHAVIPWSGVREVQVFPSAWGKKVRVIGENAYFAFRTLGEVKVQGEIKGRMGFPEGERILRQIVQAAKLKEAPREGPSQARYYVREGQP